MRLTTRWRAVTAVVLSWPVGFVFLPWLVHICTYIVQYYRDGYAVCDQSYPLNLTQGCLPSSFNPAVAWGELVLGLGLMSVVTLLIARWVLRPVGSITEIVRQLGPTSLGMRLRASGPRDETRMLADAIDAMLDRVAEGYEAQRRFAANASHELRTPLATQRALIEVSLGSALSQDQLDLVSRQLIATNERSEALVEGLLALAETQRGVMSAQPQRLDAIAADAVELHRPTATKRGIRIDTELNPVQVPGELALLERLADNLVQNAIKYNLPEDGWVRVTVEQPGRLTVVNSGPPVPPEQIPSLFEAFRRAAGERLAFDGGVGLGLTIARSIVAAHDGAIDAHANPEGGLTVRVTLPPVR
jgi:signal transduction histidine kinase